MSKRPAEELSSGDVALKGGERPVKTEDDDEAGDFEDEFEDEYESEEEIFEAGVDGRPDAEREVDERRGMSLAPVLWGGSYYPLNMQFS